MKHPPAVHGSHYFFFKWIKSISWIRDKPMAVGGMGMLSTSNYAARKFGVRAAMPGNR